MMEIMLARKPLKFDSWVDVVVFIAVIAAVYGLKVLFEKKLPNLDERIVKAIVIVVLIAVVVGVMFLLDA